MKEFIIAFIISFLLCSCAILAVEGIFSVKVVILIYVGILLSLILGLIIAIHIFILQWKLQGENKMTEKELEKVKDVNEEKAWFDLVTRVGELKKENEQLKKNAIIWHKQDDVDDIYDTINGWSVHTYICRMKDGSFNIATGSADEGCNGDVGRNIYFEINDEKYYSDDIEAWAELPRVEE